MLQRLLTERASWQQRGRLSVTQWGHQDIRTFDLLMFRCDKAMKVFGGVCCFELFPQEKIGTDCDVLEQSSVSPSSSPDGNMHVYMYTV